jgi:ubiquinone/menaquinone biosynthesis C-methylase UbiE
LKSTLYAHAPKIAKNTFQRLKRLVGADVHVHVSRVVLRHIARYMRAKEYIAGRDVLDVACGSGYGALILSNAASYRGIDLDPRALNEARREFPEFHFAQGSICELPLPNESASAITSFETLEHISQPELAMKEIARVLTPGGVFIGSIPINHPDRIHHFKPYSATEAYGIFTSADLSCTGVFVQSDLEFTETKESDLSGIASGTLIGVMRKSSP